MNNFPENYPKCLEAVSWNFEDKFGILARWNKYTNTIKDNLEFVENKLIYYVQTKYLIDSKTIPKQILNLIKYIADTFSIKWTDDEFIVWPKKEKVDGKFVGKFKREEFYKLADEALISHENADKFLKNCLNFVVKDYNKTIMKNFQNMNKKL